MEAVTDTTNAPEGASTPQDARVQEPYRQEAGTILLAATPIGDVRDASPRVVAALAGADIVAAEDTRRALALASRLGIKLGGRLVALHDHNEAEKAAGIVEAASAGARVVFVSDAGMPTVSDPGFRLARAAIDAGVPLSVLPGPSAPLVALALSGLPSDRFAFEGFLPRKDGDATRYLQDLATDPHTLIFFESPRRAAATLTRMAEVFGADRAAALCRELTKDYEEVRRGTLGQDSRPEPGVDSIHRRAGHAVRLGETHDVDIRDVGIAQRLLQRLPILGGSLEARVGSLVLALLNRHVRVHVGERRVQLGLGRARDAVRGPRVYEIRRLREVLARIDVPILRGHDQLVLVAVRVHVGGHGLGDRVAARHREGTAFAERGLNVDNDESAGHGTSQKIQ